MTARSTFRQSDLTRALKAAKKADVRVVVEIFPDGRMRIAPATEPVEHAPNPVEERKRRRGQA